MTNNRFRKMYDGSYCIRSEPENFITNHGCNLRKVSPMCGSPMLSEQHTSAQYPEHLKDTESPRRERLETPIIISD